MTASDVPAVAPLAVDIETASKLVALSPFTLRHYARLGKLRVVRFGRRIVVPMDEIKRLAKKGVTNTPPEAAQPKAA
jgi:hypothetical protein